MKKSSDGRKSRSTDKKVIRRMKKPFDGRKKSFVGRKSRSTDKKVIRQMKKSFIRQKDRLSTRKKAAIARGLSC